MSRVYLDHNATSPVRPQAVAAVRDAIVGTTGNASSLHAEGRGARRTLDEARERVGALLRLGGDGIVFTSGGSEAIAAAMHGTCDKAPSSRRRILVSAIEHSAVLDNASALARAGFEVESVACDSDGRVDADAFAARLRKGVCLACLQWANNETGVIQPVAEVGRRCREAGVPYLVDAVQAAGKIAVDPRQAHVDLLVLSGHKMGGPQGSGALVVREGISLSPLIAGGAQEKRRRGGTEAVAVQAGFGAAAETARVGLKDEARRLLRLRVRIESRLRDRFEGTVIHGESASRLPNTVNFSLPGVPGETLAIALDVAGYAVSTGSACASGSVKPSHVIRAMGLGESEARSAVRVSVGWSTTTDDVERFLDALPGVVEQVRSAAGSRSST